MQLSITTPFLTCQIKVGCNCAVSEGKPDQAKAHAHCSRHVCKVVPLSYGRQEEAGLIMHIYAQSTVSSQCLTKQNMDVLFMPNAQNINNTQSKAYGNPTRLKFKPGTTCSCKTEMGSCFIYYERKTKHNHTYAPTAYFRVCGLRMHLRGFCCDIIRTLTQTEMDMMSLGKFISGEHFHIPSLLVTKASYIVHDCNM